MYTSCAGIHRTEVSEGIPVSELPSLWMVIQNRGHFSPATVSFFAPGKATRHRVRKHTILPCFRPINAVPRMAELQPSDEVLNYQTVKKQFLKGQLSP